MDTSKIINDQKIIDWLDISSADQATKADIIRQVREITEMRLASTLSQKLAEQQLAEFESQDFSDQSEQYVWLKSVVPQLDETVEDSMKQVAAEVKLTVKKIIS